MYNSGANIPPNQGQPMPMQNQGPPMMMHVQGQMMQGQSMPMQAQGQPMAMPHQQNPSSMMLPMGAQQQQTHRQSPAMIMTQQSLPNNTAPMMTPNTPQQQQLHQPQQNMQSVTGQMSQYSPYAASVMSQNSNAPASQDYPSVPSVQSQQPVQAPPSQQQPQMASQSAGGQPTPPTKPDMPSGTTPMPFLTTETDPWAMMRRMILVDLRHDLQNWTAAANALAQKRFRALAADAADATGGVSSDMALKSVPPPPSNINNPLSVNPQSVAPPPSMNPMSVNAPSSAADGETAAAGGASDGSAEGVAPATPLNAEEQYVNCRNKLLNTIDAIERSAATIQEVIHSILRLESTCLVSVPMDYATVEVSQLQQKFVDEKRQQMSAITKVLDEMKQLREEIIPRNSTTQAASQVAVPMDAKPSQ